MAINIVYGPIQQALQLARQAGQGESFAKRFAMQMDAEGLRQRDQQLADNRTATAMQDALAWAGLNQRGQLAQEEMARRDIAARADADYRNRQATVAERRADLGEQRYGQDFAYQKSQDEIKNQLEARRVAATEGQLGVSQQRASAYEETAEGKQSVAHIKTLESSVRMENDRLAQLQKLYDSTYDSKVLAEMKNVERGRNALAAEYRKAADQHIKVLNAYAPSRPSQMGATTRPAATTQPVQDVQQVQAAAMVAQELFDEMPPNITTPEQVVAFVQRNTPRLSPEMQELVVQYLLQSMVR